MEKHCKDNKTTVKTEFEAIDPILRSVDSKLSPSGPSLKCLSQYFYSTSCFYRFDSFVIQYFVLPPFLNLKYDILVSLRVRESSPSWSADISLQSTSVCWPLAVKFHRRARTCTTALDITSC